MVARPALLQCLALLGAVAASGAAVGGGTGRTTTTRSTGTYGPADVEDVLMRFVKQLAESIRDGGRRRQLLTIADRVQASGGGQPRPNDRAP